MEKNEFKEHLTEVLGKHKVELISMELGRTWELRAWTIIVKHPVRGLKSYKINIKSGVRVYDPATIENVVSRLVKAVVCGVRKTIILKVCGNDDYGALTFDQHSLTVEEFVQMIRESKNPKDYYEFYGDPCKDGDESVMFYGELVELYADIPEKAFKDIVGMMVDYDASKHENFYWVEVIDA